jgi:hypothetical protein
MDEARRKQFRHAGVRTFADHPIDMITDGSMHAAEVRHPETHEVIHTTDAHKSPVAAHKAAKDWVQTSSPQAHRAPMFKSETSDKSDKSERLKREGYTFHHSKSVEGGDHLHHIRVKDKSGTQVGRFSFHHFPEDGDMNVQEAEVHKDHRRKGIATHAYVLAEKKAGAKLFPQDHSGNQSHAATRLWAQKNRPFGKAEKQEEEPMSKSEGKFKKIGEIHHWEHAGARAADMYQHAETGKYHHEGAAGDGPSEEGHDTPEHAMRAFKRHAAVFNQRESDMNTHDARKHAEGFHFVHDKAQLKKNEDCDATLSKGESRSTTYRGHTIESTGTHRYEGEGFNTKKVATPWAAEHRVSHEDDKGVLHLHPTSFSSREDAKRYIDRLHSKKESAMKKTEESVAKTEAQARRSGFSKAGKIVDVGDRVIHHQTGRTGTVTHRAQSRVTVHYDNNQKQSHDTSELYHFDGGGLKKSEGGLKKSEGGDHVYHVGDKMDSRIHHREGKWTTSYADQGGKRRHSPKDNLEHAVAHIENVHGAKIDTSDPKFKSFESSTGGRKKQTVEDLQNEVARRRRSPGGRLSKGEDDGWKSEGGSWTHPEHGVIHRSNRPDGKKYDSQHWSHAAKRLGAWKANTLGRHNSLDEAKAHLEGISSKLSSKDLKKAEHPAFAANKGKIQEINARKTSVKAVADSNGHRVEYLRKDEYKELPKVHGIEHKGGGEYHYKDSKGATHTILHTMAGKGSHHFHVTPGGKHSTVKSADVEAKGLYHVKQALDNGHLQGWGPEHSPGVKVHHHEE